MYSFYSFLTSALDGGEWSASRLGRALPPGKEHPVPIGSEAGWAPEPVWTQGLEKLLNESLISFIFEIYAKRRLASQF
jgi:hypothetical protein